MHFLRDSAGLSNVLKKDLWLVELENAHLKTAMIGIIILEQVAYLPRRLSRKPGIFLSCVLLSGIAPLEQIEIPPDCYLCLSVVFCMDKAD